MRGILIGCCLAFLRCALIACVAALIANGRRA
jgi:hypothetical protein